MLISYRVGDRVWYGIGDKAEPGTVTGTSGWGGYIIKLDSGGTASAGAMYLRLKQEAK